MLGRVDAAMLHFNSALELDPKDQGMIKSVIKNEL